jgi:hypothetical protein
MLLANPQRRFVNLFNSYERIQKVGNTVCGAWTDLHEFTSFNVIIDSFVIVQSLIHASRAVADGASWVQLYVAAGTGTVEYFDADMSVGNSYQPSHYLSPHIIGNTWRCYKTWVLRATASGSITLRFRGNGAAGTVTVNGTTTRAERYLFL